MTTTAPDTHALSADSTREDVEEALGHVLRVSSPEAAARRAGSRACTTFADELLTLWEAARD